MFKCREESRRARRRVDEGLSGALDENGIAEVCQKHTSPHQTSPILHHTRRHHGRQRYRESRGLYEASSLKRRVFEEACSRHAAAAAAVRCALFGSDALQLEVRRLACLRYVRHHLLISLHLLATIALFLNYLLMWLSVFFVLSCRSCRSYPMRRSRVGKRRDRSTVWSGGGCTAAAMSLCCGRAMLKLFPLNSQLLSSCHSKLLPCLRRLSASPATHGHPLCLVLVTYIMLLVRVELGRVLERPSMTISRRVMSMSLRKLAESLMLRLAFALRQWLSRTPRCMQPFSHIPR